MTDKQFEEINQERRESLKNGSRLAMAASVLGAMGLAGAASAAEKKAKAKGIYDEPEQYAMPRKGMTIDKKRVALVVVDPQIDFLSPKGVTWGVVGESVTENNTVENIERLFKAAKAVDMPVVVSPHY